MRITSKGQVTIPQAVRDAAGFMPGTDVEFVVDGGEVKVRKVGSKRPTRGERIVNRLRGTAQIKISTDDLMRQLRGWDEEPPGVLD